MEQRRHTRHNVCMGGGALSALSQQPGKTPGDRLCQGCWGPGDEDDRLVGWRDRETEVKLSHTADSFVNLSSRHYLPCAIRENQAQGSYGMALEHLARQSQGDRGAA